MNPKLEVRSLRERPDICDGPCAKPLGTHRIVTVDSNGNPVRFNADGCQCFTRWQEKNLCGFLRRAS